MSGHLATKVDDWHRLDDAYALYLALIDDPPWGSLLSQTILTGAHRRSLFSSVQLPQNTTVLDIGTGFGPIPLEFAHRNGVRVIGVDPDVRLLAAAEAIAHHLEASGGWQAPGARIEFREGVGENLPVPDESVDFVTARLLFQHVDSPEAVVREAFRVLRPGGRFMTYDVDDGLGAVYPPISPAVALLDEAYAALQTSRGGDRKIGRKLPHIFGAAGFEVENVVLLPQATYGTISPEDPAVRVSVKRYTVARKAMIERGLIAPEDFDEGVRAYETDGLVPRCWIENQVVVIGRKP